MFIYVPILIQSLVKKLCLYEKKIYFNLLILSCHNFMDFLHGNRAVGTNFSVITSASRIRRRGFDLRLVIMLPSFMLIEC